MAYLLRYSLDSGIIHDVWHSNTRQGLQPVKLEEIVGYAYYEVLDDAGRSAHELQAQWYVHEGLLVRKAYVTITATPNPFPADPNPQTSCAITLEPFVPSPILVNRAPYTLTDADPVLELTSTVPAFFVIELPIVAPCWGPVLTVEAL